jgi:hypothetical protein
MGDIHVTLVVFNPMAGDAENLADWMDSVKKLYAP